ncbi:trypsin-like peptidase domain-containing protein [Umboniibacter marinipuniceus]|uniref:Probable periplasmic serine endoprotease DegP-like n=1 Tax=Umboniibacter marinipuniceus TaxID=569599 RepID=A0A3M0A4L7_9GAMM|nr:trypsin-like peptidase domain-containing protein [Umboniibacter marinipuniceus]RMA79324.1 serine protease Do [Umboniibacter marinipuniceus]
MSFTHRCYKVSLLLVCLVMAPFASANQFPDLVDLIENNSPSVVKIEVESVREVGRRQMPEGMPDMFRRFFDEPRNRGPQRAQSSGSGFVISDDGYILTNDHVVANGDSIVVRFPDQREYDAEVVGQDPRSDLALLKIDAEDLRPVRFASAQPKVGEWVVAIGSPFGLDYSASAGIVSARGRSLPTENGDNYVPFLQTDVAINPGNSGGPLFNLEGEVVGINSQIFTRSGGYMGLSFAIPSDVALQVVEQLKENGSVSRGWLGVAIMNVDRDLAEANGLERSRGALITLVEKDGPAAEGGLQIGDIVLEFDGKAVMNSGDLPHIVGLSQAGESYSVNIMRELEPMTLTVTLGELPNSGSPAKVGESQESEAGALGVVAANLSEDELTELDIEGGVRVKAVVNGSAADRAGLRPGDVINLLNFKEVMDIESLTTIEADLPVGQKLPIRFFRNGQPVFRTIELED